MRFKGDGHACCVLDVADAFLTVDQRIPTVVKASLGDQQSHVQHFRLLKLLPGQRDGTIRWHESFTEYLDSKLGLEPYVPCPALFKLKNVAVAGLLHVDDLFSEGQRKGLDVMVSCVQEKYKCTVSWLCEHGDEVSFLKKAYRLVRDDLLIIQPHPRHVEKLVEMFNLTRARSKSSPLPTNLPTDDEELSGEQSAMFRTAVGVLLYLQSDVIEAQFGIRWLAQHMSRPTTGALRVLKHMILYLRDTSGYAIGFPVPTIGIGVSVQSKAGHDVLETHTDADWAGDKVHRKSVSGCVITLNSHLLSSSSRTQKSIALSSGESEYASAVSGTCDQVFIRNAVEFVLGTKVESHLLLDSAAARGVIARQGAGRIRHLEAKMLWLQQYARESLQVHPVDGKHNVSDLGTKSLQGPRIRALLHKVGIRDVNDDYALVGSEEFQNLLDGNTVRKLVRLVKQQGNAGNSVGLQVAMIVLSHALSQHAVAAAADSEEQDVAADEGTDGMHSIVQQVLEMIMLVFTFAGEYAQLYPIAATSFMQGFMWMVLMCLGWCVCRRRNVNLSMRGDASGDDGMSPASPRGARSKRMTKPPKRSCDDNDDEGARGESANAGDVPMSSHESPGRLNFNVPLTPGASVKLEVSSGSASEKPSSSAASTSSTGDADGPRIVLIGFVVKAPAEIADQAAEMQRAPVELLLRSNFAPGQDSSVLARLQSANRIFIQLGAFLLRARELGVAFSLMHYMSSWLWELPPFADLLKVSSEVPVYLMSDLHRLQHFRLVYTLCDLSSLAAVDRTDAMTQKLFCDRFAAALSTQVAASGLGPSPLRLPEVRAAAQNQPKASKLPPLVPEFAYTQRLTCEGHPPLDAKKQLTHPWNGVPKHARLLRSSASEGGATEESAQQATNISSQKPRHTEYVFGVYREPVQFVYQAVALQHPFDAARALPDKLVRVLFATLTKGPLCIMRNRLLLLQKWNQWAKDLRSDEASLQASLHPSVRKVLQGKKLLLLDKIARSLDWPDKHLHRDLCAGFKLSGVPDPTGVFEPDHKPALSSEEQFWDAAEVLKHQLWARVREQPAQEYDAELVEITLGETGASGGKGWLEGPLSFSELQDRFKGQWMPCRRFAVWQNKWRPIDDLSESGLNATFGCHEKIPLRALDEVVWICTKIMQAASARGDVTLQLSSGESLKGKLHERQGEEQSKAIVTIRHPSQTEPIMLEMEILTALYYDDYPVVSPCLLGNSTAAAFTSVMSQTIAVAIEEIITRGHVAPRELPSLFGRLQFAEAQILGRMGRLAIHDLRSLERSSAARVNLTAQHLEALLLLKERVVSGAPRTVSASAATSPIVIFTDGCFEPDAANPAGVGGVMFAPSFGGGLKVRAFGSLVPKTLLEAWHAKGKRHLIGQVEMFAVIIARSCWANVLDSARVIYFVDHSGVLAACISGSSKEDTWRKLLCAFEKADSLPAMQWFSRVPSHSNISDGPSRGRWEGLLRAFPECVIDDPCCPLTGTLLQRFV
ncbi:unnamed protein product [Symbiodinium sp. CCMP2592]|nr:unnamed protein product [Symbiodinium sp. CCMP2592]